MNGFVSYAHHDFRMFGEFRTHLKSIERAFALNLWSDTRISAGHYWNSKIEDAIEHADVFILLASPDFIASDYIYDHEIPAIKKRHQLASALVIPVVLKRCAWQMVANVLQAVPSENGFIKPIEDWRRRSDGFDQARAQITAAITDYFAVAPQHVDWKMP